MSNNPLKQYFRQPAIYIRLPSQGKFYPTGTLHMPANGELPVYPMTAVDEITYRTPDALFNGSATVDVISSCVPDIKDPWAIPTMDVDTILVAIRIASFGHDMEIETQCPGCRETANFGLDLRSVLDKMKTPDYSSTIRQGDLEIHFKPLTYKNLNDNNLSQFEEQKVLQMLPDTDIPDVDKMQALNQALKKITDITVRALSNSISHVKTPDAMVTEPVYIEEMLKNCDRKLFNRIRDHVIDIKSQAEIQPLKIDCPKCQNHYEQPLSLDMASFFGVAS